VDAAKNRNVCPLLGTESRVLGFSDRSQVNMQTGLCGFGVSFSVSKKFLSSFLKPSC
jgi:hypothetical protein